MSDIFISYAKEDRARVRVLADALEGLGWSVFWDRTIPPGMTWQNYIGREIQEARCVLVAWSEAAIQSNWVLEEAGDASKRGVLIPLFLDEVEAPLGFRSLQAADLSSWDGVVEAAAFQQLVQGMARLLGVPRLSAAEAARREEELPTQASSESTMGTQNRELEDARSEAKQEKQPQVTARKARRLQAATTFMRSALGLALTGAVLVAVVLSLLFHDSAILPPGSVVRLQSPTGDYLHRTEGATGDAVTTWHSGYPGNDWTVEEAGDGKIRLRSVLNDYLYRTAKETGSPVTTEERIGTYWTVENTGREAP